MRWLRYPPCYEPREMYEDLSSFTLEKLYEIQNQLEKRMIELRTNEPSAKRKYEKDHIIWFSLCQSCLADLREVNNAIYIVKKRQASQNSDQQIKS